MKVSENQDCTMKPDAYEWMGLGHSLDAHGNTVLPSLRRSDVRRQSTASVAPQGRHAPRRQPHP